MQIDFFLKKNFNEEKISLFFKIKAQTANTMLRNKRAKRADTN